MEYIIGTALFCTAALVWYVVMWLEVVSRRMHREEKVYRKILGDEYVDEGKRKGWMYKRLFDKATNR